MHCVGGHTLVSVLFAAVVYSLRLRIFETIVRKLIDSASQDLSLTGGFGISILGEERALAPTLRTRPSCLSALKYLRYNEDFNFQL